MAGFIYYVPDATTAIPRADLAAAGIGHAFQSDRYISKAPTPTGPGDGGKGVILADSRHVDVGGLQYRPDCQTWRKVPHGPAWVGLPGNERRPTPDELERLRLLDGHPVALADGNEWKIPVARGATDSGPELVFGVRLPQTFGVDETGEWCGGNVVDDYAELWSVAQRYWDATAKAVTAVDDDDPESAIAGYVEVPFSDWLDGCVVALAANYRVGVVEVSLLRLLDTDSPVRLLNAVIDWPTVTAFLKKKLAADGSDIVVGQPATLDGTDPP